MSRVLIVCSVHHETGNATVAELHWLLGRLSPDVLFLEHSAADLAAFVDRSFASLELAAAFRYRERNAADLVPVGMPVSNAAEFKLAADAMFDRIVDESPRYCELYQAIQQHTGRGGFAFLNSSSGFLLQSEGRCGLRFDALADPMLSDTFARWTRMNGLRELTMISGVEEFARRKSFSKGILIVGAAHRTPLFDTLRHRGSDSLVSWEFEWDLDVENLSGDPRPDGMVPD
jgi:hypothetical protein